MCLSTTGKEFHVMTAVIQFQVMIVITANVVIATFVVNAQLTARCVTPPCVWAVLTNAPAVMSRSARTVLLNARIVKKFIVRIV